MNTTCNWIRRVRFKRCRCKNMFVCFTSVFLCPRRVCGLMLVPMVEIHEVPLCRAQLAAELQEQWAHCSALEAFLDFQSNQQLSIEMSWIHSIYHILSSRDTTTTSRENHSSSASHTQTCRAVEVTLPDHYCFRSHTVFFSCRHTDLY